MAGSKIHYALGRRENLLFGPLLQVMEVSNYGACDVWKIIGIEKSIES